MSLSYNFAKTEWAKQSQEIKDQEWPIVRGLLLMCPVLGITGVTDDNLKDVEARLRYYESLCGPIFNQDILFPVSILKQLVGLTTNVTAQSWKAYSRRIADSFYRDHTR